MPFPLVHNALSGATEVHSVDPAPTVTPTGAYTWNKAMENDLFPPVQRSAALTVAMVQPTPMPSITAIRKWGGIGTTVIDVSDGWHLIS